MNRAEAIAAIKKFLDARRLADAEQLSLAILGTHPDVAERGLLAVAKRRASAPVALRPGYYTVVDGEGHVTFRVRPKRGADDGTLVVARLGGPDNTSDYHGVAFARGNRVFIWKKHRDDARLADALSVLAQDPDAAGKGYALQSGNCYRCGRLLTTPESVALGLGPVCASRD